MVHKGEIIKEAIEESGVKKSRIAHEMGISRGTLYNIFERMDVDNDTILKIGAIIHYDFTEKFPKLKNNKTEEPHEGYHSQVVAELKDEVDLWKGKYTSLLEEYNKLLKK